MIWVEVLSRQRDVAERFRIAGPEARIGRAYDNDVIVDDPYVAAHHLRIFRDESGQLVAEDDGSANGTFLDRGKDRLTRVNIDGTKPIRIGQTLLRVRESNHAVEPERLARPERGIAPIVGIAVLGLAIVGIDALKIWLTQAVQLSVVADDHYRGSCMGGAVGFAVTHIIGPPAFRAQFADRTGGTPFDLRVQRSGADCGVRMDMASGQHLSICRGLVCPCGDMFPAFA
jgi:hypothetical protein